MILCNYNNQTPQSFKFPLHSSPYLICLSSKLYSCTIQVFVTSNSFPLAYWFIFEILLKFYLIIL